MKKGSVEISQIKICHEENVAGIANARRYLASHREKMLVFKFISDENNGVSTGFVLNKLFKVGKSFEVVIYNNEEYRRCTLQLLTRSTGRLI